MDCIEMVDDKHCVLLAGRVAPQHQRKGIQQQIAHQAFVWAPSRSERPTVGLATAMYNPRIHHTTDRMKYGSKWVRPWRVSVVKL